MGRVGEISGAGGGTFSEERKEEGPGGGTEMEDRKGPVFGMLIN